MILLLGISIFYFHDLAMAKIASVITILFLAYLSWMLWDKNATTTSIGVSVCNIGIIIFAVLLFKSEIDAGMDS
jgi:hypothetical protein